MSPLCLSLFLVAILAKNVGAAWPASNTAPIRLLGLFPDPPNASETTPLSFHSRAMFQAAITLAREYNITLSGQSIGCQWFQTSGDAINALASTCSAVSASNLLGVVGPGFSREAHILIPFATKVGIPVVSYGSTDPTLSDRSSYPAFYRTVPSDNIAARAIAKLFMRFNWTACIMIYQNDAFGTGAANAIDEAFGDNDLTVTDTLVFDITTRAIRGDLRAVLTKSPTRIIILWAVSTFATLILQEAFRVDVLGPQYTWILSTTPPLSAFNHTFYEKMTGILTIEPVVGGMVNAPINNSLLNAAFRLWQEYEPETFPGPNNVDDYALFAFDATWLLIEAWSQLCSRSNTNASSCTQFVGESFCFDRSFVHTAALYDYITNFKYLGVSGSLQFANDTTDRVDGIYYVSKNIQIFSNNLSAVPVLVWSRAEEWSLYSTTSVIVWPGNSLAKPTGFASLVGVSLRIVVTETAPFTMVTQVTNSTGGVEKKLIGYVPDLIELLRVRMGFIPNITLAVNQTFNEIIKSVTNDAYDMFVAQTTITAARRQIVGFSSSIYDNSLRIIIRRESDPPLNFFSYLTPFSVQLWFTLLGAVTFAAGLLCILEREDNVALRHRSVSSVIAMSFWYAAGVIVGYGVDFHVSTAAGRLLTIGLYILSLVLVAAYTANLASDLTISKSKDIIDSIDDIKNGKLAFSRIGILVGSSLEDYYLREISGGSKNYYPMRSKQEVYEGLLSKIIDASIMDGGVAEYMTNNVFCNLTLVGKEFERSSFGILHSKAWQYNQILDINVLSLREAGALDSLKRKWFQATYCSQGPEVSQAMTIQSMIGLFLTFGVISILALLLFLWKKRFVVKKHVTNLLGRKRAASEEPIKPSTNDIAISEGSTIQRYYL